MSKVASISISDLVRDNIKELKPFSSARSEYKGQADILLDANEMPYANDHNRYPDPAHTELRRLLADNYGIPSDRIVLGNGSDELIDMIMRTFGEPGKEVVRYINPTFGMYPVYADVNDLKKEAVDLEDDFDLNVDKTLAGQTPQHKLLFLCSPNNPTGNLLSEAKILRVLEGWSGVVVVDEAYIEFAERESLISRLDEYPLLIVLQTFSKAKGGAGLRIGAAYASKDICDYLWKVKPPYNISTYSQQRAVELMSAPDKLKKIAEELTASRKLMEQELAKISGIEKVYPSDANFILMRCEDHLALYRYLVDRGIVIRDRSKLKGCDRCLRVTVGTPEENQALITSVNEYYA